MAHVAKYSKGALGHMFAHYERAKDKNGEYIKFGNEDIDINKSHLNYNLAPNHNMSQEEFVKKRCSEVKCLNRKDVNVMCSWVVTAPKELDPNLYKDFFKESYKFLENRYGVDNVISAHVHMDETTPHIHFAFVPVVYDSKKDILKVSAKEKVCKTDLQTFHQDLEEYLEKALGREIGILNEATKEGNKSIEDLKRGSAREELNNILQEQQKGLNSLEEIKDNINSLDNTLKVLGRDLKALESVKSTIWDINHIEVKKSLIGGNVTLKKDDYEKLVKLAQKGVYNDEKLNKLEGNNKNLEMVKGNYFNENIKLRQENSELRKIIGRYKEQYPKMYAVLKENNLLGEVSKRINAPQNNRTVNHGFDRDR